SITTLAFFEEVGGLLFAIGLGFTGWRGLRLVEDVNASAAIAIAIPAMDAPSGEAVCPPASGPRRRARAPPVGLSSVGGAAELDEVGFGERFRASLELPRPLEEDHGATVDVERAIAEELALELGER